MKRTIAIIAGGDSSEHEVSMKSAEGIYSFIDKEKYNLYIVAGRNTYTGRQERFQFPGQREQDYPRFRIHHHPWDSG